MWQVHVQRSYEYALLLVVSAVFIVVPPLRSEVTPHSLVDLRA